MGIVIEKRIPQEQKYRTEDDSASYMWKLLLRIRQQSKDMFETKTVNEHDINLWFDPWLNSKSLDNLMGWQAISIVEDPNRKVSSLISNGQWTENILSLPPQITQQIQGIRLNQQHNRDFWSWKL